jgi:hypothetical protein
MPSLDCRRAGRPAPRIAPARWGGASRRGKLGGVDRGAIIALLGRRAAPNRAPQRTFSP